MIREYFRFAETGADYRTEIIGGLTTFFTMAYIIFVNPSILSAAGMDFDAVMVATCLSSAAATILMGILAKYPIALAPGMGLNVFFTYGVVIGMGVSWQIALGIVFIEGILFMVLSLLKVRGAILNIIPPDLQSAIAVGIGLFIALIGFWHAGLITRDPGGLLELGPVHHRAAILAIGGLVLLAILVIRNVRGAMLWSMLLTLIVAAATGVVKYEGIVSAPPPLAPTFLKFDLGGALQLSMATVILAFLFMDMFDTVGTLVGIGQQGGFMVDGKLPRATQALFSDAVGTWAGAMLGTSTVTSYIESAAGVGAGARTGFANLVTGLMFIAMIFFIPLARMAGGGVQTADGAWLYPITAPALIYVGSLMVLAVTRINWKDVTVALPAFLVILGIPLTFSIADGMAFGFISYPLFRLVGGKGRDVPIALYCLGALFLAYYIFLK